MCGVNNRIPSTLISGAIVFYNLTLVEREYGVTRAIVPSRQLVERAVKYIGYVSSVDKGYSHFSAFPRANLAQSYAYRGAKLLLSHASRLSHLFELEFHVSSVRA